MAYAAHALGEAGEKAASAFLTSLGYTIVQRGYRHRRAEVDLIAQYGTALLVFVEVKTRSSAQYGFPEQFVTARKRQLFLLAAEHYQLEADWHGDIRFDILALTQTSTGFHIEHFQDAFY